MCEKIQNSKCVPLQEVSYSCAICQNLNDTIQCKGTLIVVPQANLDHWILEVKFVLENIFMAIS